MRWFKAIAALAVAAPLAATLAGCADAPELSSRISAEARAAPYPTLQPLDPLLTEAALAEITPESEAALQARAARLNRRAAALRQTP